MGVDKAIEDGFDGFGFEGLEVGFDDFRDLEFKEVNALGAVTLRSLKGFDLGFEGLYSGELDLEFGFEGLGRFTDPGVEEFELLFGIEEVAVVVLAVEVGDVGAKRSEDTDGGGAPVDADRGSALGGEFALNEELVVFEIDTEFIAGLFGLGIGFEIDEEGDVGFGGSLADEVGFGATTESEEEAVDEERFSGAGFAGDGGESGLESEVGPGDEGDVFDGEGLDHGRSFDCGSYVYYSVYIFCTRMQGLFEFFSNKFIQRNLKSIRCFLVTRNLLIRIWVGGFFGDEDV